MKSNKLIRKNCADRKRIVGVLLMVGVLMTIMVMSASADITTALTEAKETVSSTLQTVINVIVVPLATIALAIVLLFNVISLVKKKRGGEGYSENITGIVMCVVAIAVVASFPAWGAQIWATETAQGGV